MLVGPFIALFVSCYDGDTCRFNVQIWPDIYVRTQVRLRGIDAPEINGKCESEKVLAVKAREFLVELIRGAGMVTLENVEQDKYGGRVVADILLDGLPAANELMLHELARPYDGGTRLGWC